MNGVPRKSSESSPSKKAQAGLKPVVHSPKVDALVQNCDVTSTTTNGIKTVTSERRSSKSSVGDEASAVKTIVDSDKTDVQELNGKGETATDAGDQPKDVKDDDKSGDKDEKKDGEDGDKKVNNRRPRNRRGRGRGGFQGLQGYPRGFYPGPPQFYGGYYYEPDYYYGLPSPPYKHNMVQGNQSRKGRQDDERNRSDSEVQRDRRAEERDRPGFFAARTYRANRARKTSEKLEGDAEAKAKESAVESTGEKAEGADAAGDGEKKKRRRKKRSKRPVMNDGLQPEYIDNRFDGQGWYLPPQRYGGYNMHPPHPQAYGGYRNYAPHNDRGYLQSPDYHQSKPRYNNPRDHQNGHYQQDSNYRGDGFEQLKPQGNRKPRQGQNKTGFFDNFSEGYQPQVNGGGRGRNSKNRSNGRRRQDTETSQVSEGHARGHSFNGAGKGVREVPITFN